MPAQPELVNARQKKFCLGLAWCEVFFPNVFFMEVDHDTGSVRFLGEQNQIELFKDTLNKMLDDEEQDYE